jgi:hypothetical protein
MHHTAQAQFGAFPHNGGSFNLAGRVKLR